MISRSTPGSTGKLREQLARTPPPRPAAAGAAVGNAGCRREHGLESFADHQLRSAGHSFTTPARPSMRRSIFSILPSGVEGDALDADRRIGGGSRISAIRQGRCVPGPNTQAGWKRNVGGCPPAAW